jgi:hypothetical protein
MITKLTISIPVWLDKIFVWPLLTYRLLHYGYTYRRIYLGEGYWTILDLLDYYRLRKYRWIVGGKDGKFYAMRAVKVSEREIKLISMHREIMNAPAGMLVDHRNRNSLDNRRANLRLATPSQNSYNRQKINSKKTSSKYRGVTYNKRDNKWTSRIKVNGKTLWLGYFDNEMDAGRVYDKAAIKYYGEFAHLNLPDEITTPE